MRWYEKAQRRGARGERLGKLDLAANLLDSCLADGSDRPQVFVGRSPVDRREGAHPVPVA
jgi:hypothetical protein